LLCEMAAQMLCRFFGVEPPQELRRLMAARGVSLGQRTFDVTHGLLAKWVEQRQHQVAHRLRRPSANLNEHVHDRGKVEAESRQGLKRKNLSRSVRLRHRLTHYGLVPTQVLLPIAERRNEVAVAVEVAGAAEDSY